MKMLIAISTCAGLSLSAPAMAAAGERAGDVAEAMISEGAAPAQAVCIVEHLGDDAERLFTAADEDLTEDEQQLLMAALDACSDVDAGE
jgi:hypothetical protein